MIHSQGFVEHLFKKQATITGDIRDQSIPHVEQVTITGDIRTVHTIPHLQQATITGDIGAVHFNSYLERQPTLAILVQSTSIHTWNSKIMTGDFGAIHSTHGRDN